MPRPRSSPVRAAGCPTAPRGKRSLSTSTAPPWPPRRSSRCCIRSATSCSRCSAGSCCAPAHGRERSTQGCGSCAAEAPALTSRAPKLVLCVIDAMAPAMLERAIEQGVAPTLQLLIERGGGQDAHGIPAMNWFHREENRYVEYGSSFRSAQRFGITRQLTDTVYNMNRAHLSPETLTVFESLDDADVRTVHV